ncbi:hypothetical protein HD806DRAFT_409604 [Xylariaceae sp. AK1471]|nr:hypothetical protein HD806DRAFT_409604 [Xylariaceae sp. AK1471]
MARMKDSNTQDESDDRNKSLREIATRHGIPIISLLLDIQEAQVQQQKFFRFLRHLECFRLHRKREQPRCRNRLQHERHMKRIPVFRCRINAFGYGKFVAVSYPWEPSDYKENRKRRYKVQDRSGKWFYPSRVRDCVWDRTFKYMHAHDIKLLWVDRQSIPQKECKVDCGHTTCKLKRAAMQTMDLVYKLSDHPIALLENRMCSLDDLVILVTVLNGKLVKGNGKTRHFRLSEAASLDEAQKALRLLITITKDRWWTRAWIFQENYVAWRKMTLLIRHSPDLETRKREHSALLGVIPGELCIKSDNFHHQVTRLCLALRMHEVKGIDQVLNTTGEYRLLLQSSDSMTAQVISDVEKRDIDRPSDRLPIIANCCQYSVRLDTGRQQVPSLSLATLAMCLLNGEILHNRLGESTPGLLLEMSVSECLKTQLFQGFYAPKGKPNLTFNKGCRFINVRLGESGVLTEGHLWRLGLTIDTATFPISKAPQPKSKVGTLTPHQQDRLAQLAAILRSQSHKDLSIQIEAYLDRVASWADEDQHGAVTFPQRYLRMMAIEVVRAIDKKKELRLANLCKSQSTVPYTGIFVWDDEGNMDRPDSNVSLENLMVEASTDFAFTASAPKRKNMPDIERHVSLQVQCQHLPREAGSEFPILYIRRWLLGLCFFSGSPRKKVLFPWPSALRETTNA